MRGNSPARFQKEEGDGNISSLFTVRQEVSCSNTGPEKNEGKFQKLVLRRPIMGTCTCTVGNDRV